MSGKFYLGDYMKALGLGEIGTLTFDDELTDRMTEVYIPISDKTELSFECDVDPSLFSQMIGDINSSSFKGATGYTLTCEMPKQVQVRYHKKKRINKKWIKRYGYKTIYKKVQLTDVHFDPSYEIAEDGTVRFTECSFVGNLYA